MFLLCPLFSVAEEVPNSEVPFLPNQAWLPPLPLSVSGLFLSCFSYDRTVDPNRWRLGKNFACPFKLIRRFLSLV